MRLMSRAEPARLVFLRRVYARQMLLRVGALGNGVDSDRRLEDAFAAIPREAFLGPGPWRLVWRGGYRDCPAEPELLYQDALFALAEERGINTGEPSLHAGWLHAVQPRPGERALLVGAGAGYYAAILAELVGPCGSVRAVEHDAALAKAAAANLAPWPHVRVEPGDGAVWPSGPTDVIYVCASCERPAAPWLEHLAEGGRLMFPLGSAAARPVASGWIGADSGVALMVTRRGAGFAARALGPAYFIMAEGAALRVNEDERERLRAALRQGGLEFVRSLRWRAPPSPQALYAGPGWSLELEEVA
jgi:protein-L-isoaspartate(D-aspartate) O-methyltransferase